MPRYSVIMATVEVFTMVEMMGRCRMMLSIT